MTMRRFSHRWRDASTPPEVLDVFLVEGRYEILLRNSNVHDPSDEWADGLDIDPDGGRYASFELQPHEARAYRYRNGKRRRAWSSLPAPVRNAVQSWLSVEQTQ